MRPRLELRIEMIPLDEIAVVNPRVRGSGKFREIVASIAKLGLKKPITVARRGGRNGAARYDLVCGQGRLEAYRALGQAEVQAVVIDATKEEVFLMSLAENLARRTRSSAELLQSITALKDAGYSFSTIAQKTDLEVSYVKGVVRLLSKGEDRLLRAVERGDIPISIAVTIVSSDDEGVQRALTDAYEKNTLRGKELLRARRVIEQRRALGKGLHSAPGGKRQSDDAAAILATYQRESRRERLVVKRARLCESRLLFVVSALRQLLQDEDFVRLLREVSLDKLPRYLAEQVRARRS
jgi:ParB family chromosome partitioning protein